MATPAHIPSLAANKTYYQTISPMGRLQICLGVFFTFAPMGVLFQIARAGEDSLSNTLLWATTSGFIALGWALSFMWTLKLLPFVILGQVVVPIVLGPMLGWMDGPGRNFDPHLLLRAVICIASISLGYIFFVRYTRGEAVQKLRLSTEMNLAARIHRSLVPSIDEKLPYAELYGHSVASSEMGGDLIDLVPHANATDLYLADVSGHGVRAGVLMAMVKSAIRTSLVNSDPSSASLEHVTTSLNRVISQVSEPDMFATFACLRIHHTREVEYALAGHLPILHYRASTRDLIELDNTSLPLGIDPEEPFQSRRLSASPGDLLIVLTDGLTEVMDSKREQLGLPALKTLLISLADRRLPDIYDEVIAAVGTFGVQNDDQSLLLARIL